MSIPVPPRGTSHLMTVALTLVSPGPVESCRTDYSSHTFKLHHPDAEMELYAYSYDLAEKVLPTGKPFEAFRGRHFDMRWGHPSGISLEVSDADSHLSTKGLALLTIPGAAWGSLDASERRDLIIDIYKWPGYYRTTRWDPQITVLNPSITIEEVIEEVAAGRLWAARFTSQQSWGQRDISGALKESPTQYFGSTQSDIRLRLYDHGVKHDWRVPSLRVEGQLRGEPADQHFTRLGKRCYEERDTAPILVCMEELTVKDALAQHADMRDTSKWEGRRKPRNWRRDAPRPAWWDEMLSHKADPLSITHRADLDWDRTIDAMVTQYGRKLWLWHARECFAKGMSSEQVMSDLLLRCGGQLRKGDEELIAAAIPRGSKELARKALKTARSEGTLFAEGLERAEVSDPG